MRIKKIIHEELGQELEKIGFRFVSGERIFWPYEREKDDVKQGITIARHRYASGYLKVYFETNAYGREPKEFCDFVPEEGAKSWEFWGYTNEEELRELLREFKRLIFTYGLDYLETISKPATDAVPTEEMNRYLYQHHQELFEEYQEKLKTQGKEGREVIEIIYQEMEKSLDEPFEKVSDMLIGLAALYGHTISWGDKGKWVWDEERKDCVLKEILGIKTEERLLKAIFIIWDNWRKHRDSSRGVSNRLYSRYSNLLVSYYNRHPEERI